MTTKLATIVVVDVVGFGARARKDEAAALAEVARLVERCKAIATKQAGRVFDTSGDSVMLEFAGAGSALDAAAEIAANPDPPVRVAVHTGEVSVMHSGDLIGRAVDVATRLQTHAKAGIVLVSEDTQRAAQGPLAQRLAPRGAVKLEKIDESINVFELADEAGSVASVVTTLQKLRRSPVAIGAGVALLAAVALFFAWPLLRPAAPARVAVFALTAPESDSELRALAAAVPDDVARALSASGVDPAPNAENVAATREAHLERARAHGAPFALDGETTREGRRLRLTVAVAGARDGATLWTNSYEGDDADALRQRAAAQTAHVLGCGFTASRRRGGQLDASSMSLLMQACAASHEGGREIEARDLMAQVVERNPNSAYARALLASANVAAAEASSEPLREQLRTEATSHAQRALRTDPGVGESYVALEQLEARNRWGPRETLLLEGLRRDEDNARLNARYADLLIEVGRFGDALPYARRASELDPLSPTRASAVVAVLHMAGNDARAYESIEQLGERWPRETGLWRLRLRTAFWSERYAESLALLDHPASTASAAPARRCWRIAVDAMRTSGPARRASAPAVLQCFEAQNLPVVDAMMLASALGDLDSAFAIARARYVEQRGDGFEALFTPATHAMRADERFMPLMKDIGLLRYWHLADRWPDFCAEPSLPYRCASEAGRLI